MQEAIGGYIMSPSFFSISSSMRIAFHTVIFSGTIVRATWRFLIMQTSSNHIYFLAMLAQTFRTGQTDSDASSTIQVGIYEMTSFIFLLRLLLYLVDKFHGSKHTEPKCLPPSESKQSVFHYKCDAFKAILNANSNICEQSFREVDFCCLLLRRHVFVLVEQFQVHSRVQQSSFLVFSLLFTRVQE